MNITADRSSRRCGAIISRRHRLAAAALAAAASAAHAQSCIWSYHDPVPGSGTPDLAVYDSALQRTIFIQTNGSGTNSVMMWSWDGGHWSVLSSGGPATRQGSAAAYDSGRNRIVLFGGQLGSSFLGDTWEWDGAAWTQRASSGPGARSIHGMAYDQVRQRTVLFGGSSGPNFLGDTWEWDGQTWLNVATTGPSPRGYVRSMAYDSSRGRTMLCGGYDSTHGFFIDLWEWDGAAWAQRPGNAPDGHTRWMVFNPARTRMIVSRMSLQTYVPQTWEIDPITAQWTVRDPGNAPWGPAAFDAARGVVAGVDGASGFTMESSSAGTLVSPYITYNPQGGTFAVGASVQLNVQASGAAPLSYQWRRGGQPVVDGGNVSGANTATLAINPFSEDGQGYYDVVISNQCSTVTSALVGVGVAPPDCYVNCDRSTTPPILNVNDFSCFLNKFAAGDTYANCDHGYTLPILNVLDFSCFLNLFAQGCP